MRELFDQAIGVAPPTRIDVDATIVRQRRILMLRPLGIAVVALAVVAAVVVAGNGLGRPAGPAGTMPIGGPGAVSPSASRSVEPPEVVLARQTTAVNELLHAGLGGGVQVADLRTRRADLQVIPSKDYPGYLAGTAHMTNAVLTSPAGTGDFGLYVDPRPGTGSSPLPAETFPEPGSCTEWLAALQKPGSDLTDPQCTDSTTPDGATVLTASARAGQVVTYLVLVWRPYSLVSVSARNCWNGWDSSQAPTSFLPQPLLTLDQLRTIAVDPRLAM